VTIKNLNETLTTTKFVKRLFPVILIREKFTNQNGFVITIRHPTRLYGVRYFLSTQQIFEEFGKRASLDEIACSPFINNLLEFLYFEYFRNLNEIKKMKKVTVYIKDLINESLSKFMVK